MSSLKLATNPETTVSALRPKQHLGRSSFTENMAINGEPPLHIAAFENDLWYVKAILNAARITGNVSDVIEERNSAGLTALQVAVIRNHENLIEYMVDSVGADVLVTTSVGETLLSLAANTRNQSLCRFLGQAIFKAISNQSDRMRERSMVEDVDAYGNSKKADKIRDEAAEDIDLIGPVREAYHHYTSTEAGTE